MPTPKQPNRRQSDPRIDAIENCIEEIEQNVVAGKDAFIKHESAEKERLDQMNKTLESINETLKAVGQYRARFEQQEKDLAKIVLTLYGNGKPGMVIEIDRLTRAVDNLVRILWIAVGLFVTAGLGAIVAHFVNPNLP